MADGDDLVIGEMNTTSNSTTKLYPGSARQGCSGPRGQRWRLFELRYPGVGQNAGIRGTGGLVGVKGTGDVGVRGETDSGEGVVGHSIRAPA